MGVDRGLGIQFRENFTGQLLAQLYTPLVKTEDIPDDALNEDFVFIHGDQTAQGFGCEFLEQNRI